MLVRNPGGMRLAIFVASSWYKIIYFGGQDAHPHSLLIELLDVRVKLLHTPFVDVHHMPRLVILGVNIRS